MVARVLDLPRSSVHAAWHAQQRRQATASGPQDQEEADQEEAAVRAQVAQLASQWPTYGYRRMTAQLQRERHADDPSAPPINSKRVRRLMGALGLVGQAPVRRCRTTNSAHPYPRYPNRVHTLAITHPDQVWVADITYIRLQTGFVYLAVLLDVFPRAIRGWELSRHLDQALTLSALDRALASGHQPAIHHSDQGVQYAATAYVARLDQVGAQISMAKQGEPRENGYAERLMRTIKDEEVALTEYRDFTDAYAQIGRFLEEVYQHKRIHSALGYLTPTEFEAAYHAQARMDHLTVHTALPRP